MDIYVSSHVIIAFLNFSGRMDIIKKLKKTRKKLEANLEEK